MDNRIYIQLQTNLVIIASQEQINRKQMHNHMILHVVSHNVRIANILVIILKIVCRLYRVPVVENQTLVTNSQRIKEIDYR